MNGGNILETSNYWRIYFSDWKHLDACCYYICKQLCYKWVVNSSRKTLNTNSGIRPYALFSISIALVVLGIVIMIIEYFKKDS